MRGKIIYARLEESCKKLSGVPVMFVGNRGGRMTERDKDIIQYIRSNGVRDIGVFEKYFAEKYNISTGTVFKKARRLLCLIEQGEAIYDTIETTEELDEKEGVEVRIVLKDWGLIWEEDDKLKRYVKIRLPAYPRVGEEVWLSNTHREAIKEVGEKFLEGEEQSWWKEAREGIRGCIDVENVVQHFDESEQKYAFYVVLGNVENYEDME